jgi:hypothetical protein
VVGAGSEGDPAVADEGECGGGDQHGLHGPGMVSIMVAVPTPAMTAAARGTVQLR